MTRLRVEHLDVAYGAGRRRLLAVRDVTFELAPGETLGLVGESGSGKSTIARALVGLTRIDRGSVWVDGVDASRGDRRVRRSLRGRIQIVMQNPYGSLNPRLTAGELLNEVLSAHQALGRVARRREVGDLLDMVGLGQEAVGRFPHEFSGGQRQRLAIARALAVRPDVLIADEITSALDVSVQAAILNLLRELQRTTGLSILFISHDLAVVRYMSNRIAVLYLGRIVETARREELFASPRHPYTQMLLDSIPGARLEDRGVSIGGEPPDPDHPPSGCAFHPRCPIGPTVHTGREVCAIRDPHADAPTRPGCAACHFPLLTSADRSLDHRHVAADNRKKLSPSTPATSA